MDSLPTALPYRTELAGTLATLMNLWWSPAFRAGLTGTVVPDLGTTEARIVWELGYRGVARPSELALSMDIGAPSVTKAVTKLLARGLVAQTVDSHDRRVRRVELTRDGRLVAERLYGVGDDMIGQIVAGWSPAEVQEFTRQITEFLGGATRFAASLP